MLATKKHISHKKSLHILVYVVKNITNHDVLMAQKVIWMNVTNWGYL